MPIHWSYKSLPELSALSDAERKEVWEKAVGQAYGRWQTLVAMWIIASSAVLVGGWLGSTFGHYFVGLAIGVGIGSAITVRVVFRIARSCLRTTVVRADKS
jgi:uncharacterized membrane protein YedE/YeeE